MSQLPLSSLYVTQDALRHFDALDEIISYVSNGGFWTPDFLARYAEERKLRSTSPVIQISKFEDGKLFLHDGHHRTIGTSFVRNYLRHDEFNISSWKYSDYNEVNLSSGWYTPYDPRTDVRNADISEWKAKIRKMLKSNMRTDDVISYIFEHQSEFRHVRGDVFKVADLAKIAAELKPVVVEL